MMDIALRFRSISPLVMHSANLSDPLHPVAIALQRYHEKTKLVPQDHIAISDLEFVGGLWTNGDRPCIPARTLEAALHEAARRRSIHADVRRSMIVETDSLLAHPGPQTIQALARDPGFRLRTPVTVDGQKKVRTRPIFNEWSIVAVIRFDPAVIGRDVVIDCAIVAGDTIGIGAGRPRLGRFSVTPALAATA